MFTMLSLLITQLSITIDGHTDEWQSLTLLIRTSHRRTSKPNENLWGQCLEHSSGGQARQDGTPLRGDGAA